MTGTPFPSSSDSNAQTLQQPEAMAMVRRVELAISTLLRVGVIASLLVVLAGAVVLFVHHPSYLTSKTDLNRITDVGYSNFPHTLGQVYTGLLGFHGRAIIAAGLLLLVSTPVLRVAISIIAFLYQRDRVFAIITAIVLILLLSSFILGKAGG